MKYPRKLERSELTGALHEATEAELLALADLSEWMTKHQLVLATGRAHGIRIGATREVRQYMLDSTDPEFAGMVAGNIEPLPRAGDVILDRANGSPMKHATQLERSRESEIQELIEKVHAWFGQPENMYEGIFHLMFEAGNVEQEFAELTVAEARKGGNEAEIDLAERLAALTVAERDRIYNAW